MKVFKGKVVSDKMQKTVKVEVERVVTHPIYGKRFNRNENYLVHDEYNHKVGDVVSFAASKPYSKMKKWKVIGEKTTAKSQQPSAEKASKKAVENKRKAVGK